MFANIFVNEYENRIANKCSCATGVPKSGGPSFGWARAALERVRRLRDGWERGLVENQVQPGVSPQVSLRFRGGTNDHVSDEVRKMGCGRVGLRDGAEVLSAEITREHVRILLCRAPPLLRYRQRIHNVTMFKLFLKAPVISTTPGLQTHATTKFESLVAAALDSSVRSSGEKLRGAD